MHGLQINKSTYNIYKYTAFLSIAVIFLLGIVFLQPFSFTENTNAATERTTNGDYYIETTTTDLNLTINTTPAGTQETASHDVTVKTDDPAGYTLTVSVNNDTSNALNLNGNTSATEKFNATSGTYDAPKALDKNSWGFADTLTKKNNDQWAAVPLLSNVQQIKQTSSANTSGDTTTIHYAINAKYDGQHSNGNYSNTIIYSVTGNTIPYSGITDNMNMQDVTRQMCTDTPDYDGTTKTTYTLKDSRDNNSYTIRKLADGHCWMVQNLRLSAETLTSAGHSTTLKATDNDTDLASGQFIVPATNNDKWSDYTTDHTVAMIADSNNTEYGMYYSWAAAIASNTDYTTQYQNAETSICPKNWNLPKGKGGEDNSTNNDWWGLLVDGYGLDGNGLNDPTSFTSEAYNLPFSGYYFNSQQPLQQGEYGYFWSSTTTVYSGNNTQYAYHTRIAPNGWLSAGIAFEHYNGKIFSYSNKRLGFSVRCMLGS